jgi:hypothetical protein
MIQRSALGLLLGALLAGCGGSQDSAGSSRSEASHQVPPIDSQTVPSDLRHLIRLAEEWGIGDDEARLAKVDGATPAQRTELRQAVGPHQARITQWLDSFGQGDMPQEAATFMYMQLAIEEMVGQP